MNLKEIAVKCETVEQKKLVSDIMSEELGCDNIVGDSLSYHYVNYDARHCNITAYLDYEFEVKKECIYSDFIQHYPKYLIQSGDIVELSDYGNMRVTLFKSQLVLTSDSSWMPLNSFDSSLKYKSDNEVITKIIRPNNNCDLAYLQGTTIWQRKSKNDIKREAIQLEIDKLTEELNSLGGN